MANTQLHKTFSSAGNRKTFTLSFWVKRTKLSTGMYVFNVGNQEANPQAGLEFQGNDTLTFWNNSGSGNKIMTTTQVFRDPSSWYHLVFSIDTTQSTASDRVKIYVNGEQITSFSTATYPDQNYDYEWNGTQRHTIGAYYNNQSYFDGILSHIHFIDGTAYPASTFGETDATTGEWKINTSPSITMGNNGFTILKDGNTITDQSSNSNDFTLGGGTLTNTEDNPSNVFATWNALKKLTITLSNGNTTTLGNGDNGVWSTIGNNSGKWYWETQQNATSTMVGIISEDVAQTTALAGGAGVYGMQEGTTYGYYRNNGSSGQSSGFPNPTNSNVVCHALDLDNGKYFMGINGVFKNLSGTTSNIATGADPTYSSLDTTKFWFPFTESRGSNCGCDVNFGNGYFGTTAISSEGTNASGIGKFEYDVPTGYTALSTKGLNL